MCPRLCRARLLHEKKEDAMALAPTHRRVVHFGVFELDFGTGELRKAGLKIKLQDQPFQVLALLLEHPGELVTREELRQKLWPADTFVDFDTGLNTATPAEQTLPTRTIRDDR